jgi:hypothetical protein
LFFVGSTAALVLGARRVDEKAPDTADVLEVFCTAQTVRRKGPRIKADNAERGAWNVKILI